jgi:hypothetical protein
LTTWSLARNRRRSRKYGPAPQHWLPGTGTGPNNLLQYV